MDMGVSQLVRREVHARYGAAAVAAEVERQLSSVELPGLDGAGRERERDRVHFAALKVADGDAGRLAEAVRLAAADWRDLLVAASLADEDWPAVMRRAGYPVP